MKEKLVVLLLLASPVVLGQQYQLFFPGSESSSAGTSQAPTFQPSVSQGPFGSQETFPRSGEVLGNFFNGQVGTSPAAQPTFPSFTNPHRFQQQPQQFGAQSQQFGAQSQQFGAQPIQFEGQSFGPTSNYLSPPQSTSLPRQTSFFGNNYDFFRQFHNSHLPLQQQPKQQQQQQQQNSGFQPLSGFNAFQNTHGSEGKSTVAPSSPQTSGTASPFTTTQFFATSPHNDFFRNFNSAPAISSPSPSSITSPASYPSVSTEASYPSTSTEASTPSSPAPYPSSPSSYPTSHVVPTHRTAVSYPVNVVNNQNSLFTGYEEAAKALGLSHNLRVVTTETLRANPTLSIPTNEGSEVISPSPISSTEYPLTSPTPQYIEIVEEATSPAPTAPSTTVAPTTPTTTPTPTTQYRSTGRTTDRHVQNVTPRSSRQRQPLIRQPNRIVSNQIDVESEDAPPRRPVSSTPSPTTTPSPRVYQEVRGQSDQYQFPPQGRVVSQGRPLGQNVQVNSDPHGPYYYNNLQPGSLYTNTNGAYQSYYNGQQQQHHQLQQQQNQQQNYQQQRGQGLVELVPQDIEFNVPLHKMIPIPVTEEEEDVSGFPPAVNVYQSHSPSFAPAAPSFAPRAPIAPQARRTPVSPQAPIIIVTEATPKKAEEVYRVGPKGRLLKKRRRLRPQQSPPTPFAPSPTTPALSYAVRDEGRREIAPAITTYRPSPTVYADDEEKVTTYRSKFRYSPSTSTTMSTSTSTESSVSSTSDQKPKAIDSRLKSLERQIRFRNRKTNPN